MTCANCGSAAIRPNGWCGSCGQPASPPVAAPPTATPQQSWPPAQQPVWPAPPQQSPWAAPQQSQQGQWAAPQQSQQNAQPSWATDATTTFGVPGGPPAPAYQAPSPAYQPPPAQAYQPPPPSGLDATMMNGIPPYNAAPPPYLVSSHAPAKAMRTGNPFSVVAFVLAGISLLFPYFIGPLAVVFGAVAMVRREPRGRLALTLGLAGLIAGVALGVIVNALI